MRQPRTLYLFAGLVGAGVVLVGAFNFFYGGGANLFRNDAEIASLVRGQIAGNKVLFPPEDFEERPYKKEMVRQRAADLKVLVTGSSRVILLDADLLNTDRRFFYNLGVSGGTFEDHLIWWQVCKEQNVRPAVVLLGLDPWIFNEDSGEVRWKALAPELQRIQYSYLGAWQSPKYYFADWQVWSYWLKATDLMSKARLTSALTALRRSWVPPSQTLALVDEPEKPPEKYGWRADGSYLYKSSSLRNRFVGEAAKQELDGARAGRFYQFSGWHRLSQDRMQILERLLGDMRSYQVQVIGLTLPYAPAYWEILQKHRLYAQLVNQESAFLRHSFSKFQFVYYDLLNPAMAGVSSEDFHDSIHLTRSGLTKVLNYIGTRTNLTTGGFLPSQK